MDDAMHCPFCQSEKEALKVIDSRSCDAGRSIRRRRECLHCHRRFTTYERVEDPVRLTVVKKDGRRVPWDREKLLSGLQRATFKRPIPEAKLSELADEVEEECRQYDREVPTEFIGQQVADRLRRLDSVAYVRFASVYRAFKTVDELIEEARAVVEAAKMEDPGQGRLFLEQQRAKAETPPPETNGKVRKTRAKPASID
jgi:transcriptional repressor NrdR